MLPVRATATQCSIGERAFVQSPRDEVECARGVVGQTDGVCLLRRLGELSHLGFVFGRFAKSTELSEAHDQQPPVVASLDRNLCLGREAELNSPMAI